MGDGLIQVLALLEFAYASHGEERDGKSQHVVKILHIPFYLNLLTRFKSLSDINDENEFRELFQNSDSDVVRTLAMNGLGSLYAEEIIKIYSVPMLNLEMRTDLHPRLSYDKKYVAFDSSHDSYRKLMVLKLEK